MDNKAMGNMDRIKSTIAAGLKGHKSERHIEKYYEAAQSLVKTIEQATKLNIEAEGVYVNKVGLQIASGDGPDNNVSVTYQRRHKGLFPFEHDHCKVTICWEVEIDGVLREVCIEVEVPCNVDWPIIGRLD